MKYIHRKDNHGTDKYLFFKASDNFFLTSVREKPGRNQSLQQQFICTVQKQVP